MSVPAVDRVLRRIEHDHFGCWLFVGCRDSNGYGNVRAQGGRGSTLKAHRVVYEHFRGKIPDGKELDHLCRVRHCVNPDHLDPVTRQEHVLRGLRNQNTAKLTCNAGHLLSGDNLHTYKNGHRSCKACNRERLRRVRRDAGIPTRPYQTKEALELLYKIKVPLVREALLAGETYRSIEERIGVSRTVIKNVSKGRVPLHSWKPEDKRPKLTFV